MKKKTTYSSEPNECSPTNWNGEYYKENSDWQYSMALAALANIKIPAKGSLLDIGCGDGRITKFIAEENQSCNVIGIDPSESMLKVALQKSAPNLSYKLHNAVNLEFKDKFNLITAFNSLHWVQQIELALDGINKALVPGGQVLILVAPLQYRYNLHEIIDRVALNFKWKKYFKPGKSIFSFYKISEWSTLIEKAKLTPELLKLQDASILYAGKKELANSLKSWVPVGSIPENQIDDYINDIVEAYTIENMHTSSGQVLYQLDELVIVASKPGI